MSSRIRFNNLRTASGQKEWENQHYSMHKNTKLIGFHQTKTRIMAGCFFAIFLPLNKPHSITTT
jgi:hypothetical protein